MAYCSKCGTEIDSNCKICPNCESPIVENAVVTEDVPKKKKIAATIGNIVLYIIGVFILLFAFVYIGESILTGVCFILSALFAFPFTLSVIKTFKGKEEILHKIFSKIRIFAFIILFIVGCFIAPDIDTDDNTPTDQNPPVEEVTFTQSDALKAAEDYLTENKTQIYKQVSESLGFENSFGTIFSEPEAASYKDYWKINQSCRMFKSESDYIGYDFDIVYTVKSKDDITADIIIKIDEKIAIGSWDYSYKFEDTEISGTFVLGEDGKYSEDIYKNKTFSETQTGTWEIKDGAVFAYRNGSKANAIEYEHINGALVNNHHEFIKQK